MYICGIWLIHLFLKDGHDVFILVGSRQLCGKCDMTNSSASHMYTWLLLMIWILWSLLSIFGYAGTWLVRSHMSHMWTNMTPSYVVAMIVRIAPHRNITTHYKSTLQQHTATTHCNNTLQQHTAITHCNNTLQQHTAAHGNSLPLTATHCNTLQHTATHCNTLQHTSTHCNAVLHILQHTAPHCTTLNHTAPHCTAGHGATGSGERHRKGLCWRHITRYWHLFASNRWGWTRLFIYEGTLYIDRECVAVGCRVLIVCRSILLDIGTSSLQIDEAKRGFPFMRVP